MHQIQPQLDRRRLDELFFSARKSAPSISIAELGRFVVGHKGFVVFSGQYLGTVGSQMPVYGPQGRVLKDAGERVEDPVLTEMGLELVRLPGPHTEPTRRELVGLLVLRAGLLCQMLDGAFQHLQNRESGGKNTLQHELVKADFVACYGVADQMLAEAALFLDTDIALDMVMLHRELSHATMEASKLMGGHGYLVGAINEIEFVSLCLSALMLNGTNPAPSDFGLADGQQGGAQ